MKIKLIAKTILAEISAKDGKVPEWPLLFADGWNELEGGERFLVDREAFELFAKYVERRGNEIVFDYEHQSLKDVKAPAAGWIKEYRYEDGVGILARIEWTEEAASYIVNKEYRYFSPVFYIRKSDKRLVGIHSVALTNTPKINNLPPLLAKLGDDFPGKEDNGMDFLKKLIAKLGLADDASEDDVLAAIATLDQKAKDVQVKEVVAKDVLAALDMTEGDTSAVVASIHALKQSTKGSVSREEFDKLQKQLREKDATEVVAKAMAEGKITPDQKEWAQDYAERDLEGFKTFVAKAPVVIPKDKLPGNQEKGDKDTLDETTLAVAKMMDVSKEDIKKYGGDE